MLVVCLDPYARVKHNSVRANARTRLLCHLVAGLRLEDKILKTKDKNPQQETEMENTVYPEWGQWILPLLLAMENVETEEDLKKKNCEAVMRQFECKVPERCTN